MVLSKYLAHTRIASRRAASELVKAGNVFVNNRVITEPGYVLAHADIVRVGKKIVSLSKKKYFILNKPAGVITTCSDEYGRKTVLNILREKDRVYPVGRLDKDTTGILLCTNDGDLAYRLTHPKFGVKKVYEVILDKQLAAYDAIHLKKGIKLVDGFFRIDGLRPLHANKKHIARVTIHSGKKRIIRRMFEKLSYTVIALDRINFAGLTKRGLARGAWRHLTQREIELLHMI